MDMRSERLLLNITFDRVYDDEPSQMKSLGMVVPILTNDKRKHIDNILS